MPRRRSSRLNCNLGYQSLESRQLLANTGYIFTPHSSTLHVVAAETNIESATFANDIKLKFSGDRSELIVEEANRPEQRFDASDIERINYLGTSLNDRFLNFTAIRTRVLGFDGNDFISSGGGNDRVIGGPGNDIVYSGHGDDVVSGSEGDDQLIETLTSTGDDFFLGDDGNDTIRAGQGNDRIIGHAGDDDIDAGPGNDRAFGFAGADEIVLGTGDDVAFGGEGDDTIFGGDGNDRIRGDGGDDELYGENGNDSLHGGDGGDTIEGAAGNDELVGQNGNDILRGGVGMDRIVSSVVTVQNLAFGFDIIETGNDNAVDTVIAHPIDQVSLGSQDRLHDTNAIRLYQNAQFLIDNSHRPGWQQVASGLQLRNVSIGNGPSPTINDVVRVNYSGTFIDGIQFDANNRIQFSVNRLIAGWTEALQLMRVGSVVDLAIPASLAYGSHGTGNIPGGSTLLFRIELLDIVG